MSCAHLGVRSAEFPKYSEDEFPPEVGRAGPAAPPAQALIALEVRSRPADQLLPQVDRGLGTEPRSPAAARGLDLLGCRLEPEDFCGAVARLPRRRCRLSGASSDVADRELARLADPDRLAERAVARIPGPGEAVAANAQQLAAVGAERQVIGRLVEAVERPLLGQAPEDDDGCPLLLVFG